MTARGRPQSWTPRRVLALRRYAQRGFSQHEAALCMGTTYGSIINIASKLGIHFSGPSGAPLMNRNNAKWRTRIAMERK